MALSMRTVDREGHVADVICDALLRFAIEGRYRRKQEPQEVSIRMLLINFLVSLGPMSLHAWI